MAQSIASQPVVNVAEDDREPVSIYASSSPAHSRSSSALYTSEDLSETDIPLIEEKENANWSSSLNVKVEDLGLLEAQKSARSTIPDARPPEYATTTSRKLTFLALYFLLNLGLTLSNKALLQHAKLPWLLTVMHTSTTALGCFILELVGYLKVSGLNRREKWTLAAFSSLFTLNIAISNVSLALVSVPFHQILRATCPIATIFIYKLAYNRTYHHQTYLSMVPIIAGVALTTIGDYQFTAMGLVLTLLGVLLAATKTVATNRIMTGSLKLSPMEFLYRMSPMAALQCLVFAYTAGELGQFQQSWQEGNLSGMFFGALAGNAIMAFCLNVVSFQTNKVAGALTMSVCGNLKQCLTIALGIFLFSVQVTLLNGTGMIICLAGAAWYSKVELDRKSARS